MANRLISEASPYLLQHAHNPVDWYPWGDEAFEEARRRNVPVLLSVGYSACHWCHVMERESFANEAVAARLNSLFVPVKVDREERPDVDEVYMRAVQAFNRGQGGWPMTVFLTPDREPFFGGTYFPPAARGGLPGFVDVLSHVSDVWRRQPTEVVRITEQVRQLLEETSAARPAARRLATDWLEQIAQSVLTEFDTANGGFGGAPKFPSHGTLAVLLAHHRRTRDALSLSMVTSTLDGMAKGGLYDVVGGGFARYSVDREWRIPHFEKMLYDNAQLIPLYLDAWKVTQNEHYARIVRETVQFLLREMALMDGSFAASFDADSIVDGELVEGAYYAFTLQQLRVLFGPDVGRLATLLGVSEDGTFEHGASVLRCEVPLERMDAADRDLVRAALPKLGAARDERSRPARDDKRIVAWNALAISALARASALEPAWREAAERAARSLLANARVDGQWRRLYMDGRASAQAAFVDDHTNWLAACLDLYEATFDPAWLDEADLAAEQLVRDFWDEETGSLYLTGRDQPTALTRGRAPMGGAEPSPIGTAALSFVRLGTLRSRPEHLERASRLVRSVQFALARGARALGSEALAGAWLATGGMELAFAGDGLDTLVAVARGKYLPFAVVGRVDPRLPWTEGKAAMDGKGTAFLCEGFSCLLPTSDPAVLAEQIEERVKAPPPSSTAVTGVRIHAPDLPAAPGAWSNTAEPLTLERLRGQVVVLDFWTSCCINCLHVLPELAALETRYEGRPVVVIGVHCAKFDAERDPASVRRAIERYGIRHPVVNDPDHTLWEEYAIRSWPTVVVLDPSGRIAYQRSGEFEASALVEVIDGLLTEADPAARPVPMAANGQGSSSTLRFPGRIHVWPDAFDQSSAEPGAPPNGAADLFAPGATTRVYIADSGHHRILELTAALDPDGWPLLTLSRTFGCGEPGAVDGPADEARFHGPQGIRRQDTTLYVADTENHQLRAIDLADGTVRTLAGTGRRGTAPPTTEGLANPTFLDLRSPWDVEVMPFRNHHLVFVAMAGAHQIWVWANGHLGIHVGSGHEDHVDGAAMQAALAQPSGLALLGRYLVFVDAETSSVRAVDLQSHQVMTVMGRGLFDFGDRDGSADVARLQHPLALTFADDNVYVADTYNNKVKSVGLTEGRTRTVVGGDPKVLCEPSGIARAGRFLLVADTGNHRIRAVDPATGEIRDVPIRESTDGRPSGTVRDGVHG